MFSDPIQPRGPDYFDRVADGFSDVMDWFGIAFSWGCAGIFIVFGWPFALLSWFRR